MPQRFLRGPDLVHQQNGIGPCADLPDGLLCDFGYGCMEQEPPGWRLGRVIALDHPRSFPLFCSSLNEGWIKFVCSLAAAYNRARAATAATPSNRV